MISKNARKTIKTNKYILNVHNSVVKSCHILGFKYLFCLVIFVSCHKQSFGVTQCVITQIKIDRQTMSTVLLAVHAPCTNSFMMAIAYDLLSAACFIYYILYI